MLLLLWMVHTHTHMPEVVVDACRLCNILSFYRYGNFAICLVMQYTLWSFLLDCQISQESCPRCAESAKRKSENFMCGSSNVCMKGVLLGGLPAAAAGDTLVLPLAALAARLYRQVMLSICWIIYLSISLLSQIKPGLDDASSFSAQFGIFALHPGLQWMNFARLRVP